MTSKTTILGGGITVDLGTIVSNWRALDRVSGKALTGAVLKADAYGAGAKAVGRVLYNAGARFFFVATPDEGVTLKQAIPQAHVFILNGLVAGTAREYAHYGLMPVLSSLEQLDEWLSFCLSIGQAVPAALNFDTGFNRLGFRKQEIAHVRGELDHYGYMPQMIMSHFACSDQPNHEMTRRQNSLFQDIMLEFPNVPASLSNSSGLMASKEYHYQLVRPGIAIYGGKAIQGKPNPMGAVFSVNAQILQVKNARVGETVGYGATYRLRRDSRIAIVSLGYADGYFRSLSGVGGHIGGRVAINGTIVPVIGRVSMDLTAIDVTDVPGIVQAGNLVELLGPNIGIDDVADGARTISYELLTNLSRRMPRTYVNVPAGVDIES